MSKDAERLEATTASADARAALLTRLRALQPPDRLSAIDHALNGIETMPTTQSVFLRKALLRMQDAARLEMGIVTEAELHRENSPFAKMDFRRARLTFRPRVHA